MNRQLPGLLKARLEKPLPGPMVGSRFEPTPRMGRHYDQAPADARQAAVLALLYPHEGRWYVPLTLRPGHLAAHAGQISLPGGAIEPGETSWQAAVREFHEELGAEGLAIRPLGRLSPIYVEASHFRVDSWIGLSDDRPAMTPHPAEVEALLEVPLDHLVNPANFGCHERERAGAKYNAPHFAWESYRIWGATCMILGELVTVLEGMRDEG